MILRRLAVLAALSVVIPAAQAAPGDGLASAILQCSVQPDERAQLTCYNRLAAQIRAGGYRAPAPAAAPGAPSLYAAPPRPAAVYAPPPQRPAAPSEFAQESVPFHPYQQKQANQITARVVNVAINFFKHFTVTLDNGQVWRQEDADSRIARFDDKKPNIVTIRRGFLDSYHLTIEGRYGSYDVRRVK